MDMMLSIFGALVLWSAIPFLIFLVIFVLAVVAYFILVGYDTMANKAIKLRKQVLNRNLNRKKV